MSSYQGGHVEYFEYLVESLRAPGAGHVQVVGGGGGVIVPDGDRAAARVGRHDLLPRGRPADGPRRDDQLGRRRLRLRPVGRPAQVDRRRRSSPATGSPSPAPSPAPRRAAASTRRCSTELRAAAAAPRRTRCSASPAPAARASRQLTDELVRRFRVDQQDKLRIAVIAVDPTRRKGGGALLGDRIRMNSLDGDRVFFRSLATRGAHELPEHLADVIDVMKAAGFDLVIVETPGIGQGDAAIVPFVDHSLYVMTPEFGAASQLEKIDMLDFADVVAINKFERRGAKDALRDVGRQLVRNREAFGKQPEDMPVFGTTAATFNDDGVTALYQHLRGAARRRRARGRRGHAAARRRTPLLRHPPGRARRPGALPRRDHRDRPRLPRADRPSSPRRRAGCSGSSTSPSELVATATTPAASTTLLERRRKAAARTRSPTRSTAGRPSSSPTPATSRSSKVRDQEIHTKLTRESLSAATRSRASRCPGSPTTASWWRSGAARTCPATSPSPPASSRSSATARTRPGCSPARATRSAPTAASSCSSEGGDGHPALDRVRLGDALRPRPRPAPRHLRQGRHLRRLGRDPRRHEGALRRLRPGRADDLGVDDDQRPGADRAGVLPQHRHRPAGRRVPRAARAASRPPRSAPSSRRTPWRTSAAPCRPTSSRRTRARTPACSPPSSRLRMMADIQEWFIDAAGAQLLLGVDLRLPHRRGRGEPHQPARVHPGQRLHLRRGLPRPRHGHRRLRARTCRSSSPTAWTRSTPCSAGSPAASGRSRCGRSTAPTSARRS